MSNFQHVRAEIVECVVDEPALFSSLRVSHEKESGRSVFHEDDGAGFVRIVEQRRGADDAGPLPGDRAGSDGGGPLGRNRRRRVQTIRAGTRDFEAHRRGFRVAVVCTTDDPAEPLTHHAVIRASGLATRVYPTFRADRVLDVDQPVVFNAWVDRLAATASVDIRTLNDLLDALRARHQDFHDAGGRLSDHGLPYCYAEPCGDAAAASMFDKVRGGRAATAAPREATPDRP